MPHADGQLITLDVTVVIWGVSIGVTGTVEVLAIRKRLEVA
jgi:hypothetical protein